MFKAGSNVIQYIGGSYLTIDRGTKVLKKEICLALVRHRTMAEFVRKCVRVPCLHLTMFTVEYNGKTFSDLILRQECVRLIKRVLCETKVPGLFPSLQSPSNSHSDS